MRGHTNNRVLTSCLSALARKAKAELIARQGYPEEIEYFTGQLNAVQEVAILMGLELKDDQDEGIS